VGIAVRIDLINNSLPGLVIKLLFQPGSQICNFLDDLMHESARQLFIMEGQAQIDTRKICYLTVLLS
jgi:hypothetical protein